MLWASPIVGFNEVRGELASCPVVQYGTRHPNSKVVMMVRPSVLF